MLIRNMASFSITVLLLGSLAHAESGQSYSLDAMLKNALASNPEILAAKHAFESASARIPQAASLNDPMIAYEYDRITADRDLTGEPMKSFSVSQEVPFPTKLYLRAKIASKLAKAAYENYKAKEREVVSRLKSAYAEVYLLDKQIEINQENRSILDSLYKTATGRYTSGKGTKTDALKAQVELARIENELIMLQQRRVVAQAKLNVTLNKDPREAIGSLPSEAPVNFTKSLDDFYVLARQHNPELKAYAYAVERGKLAYKLSLNEFLPDVSFQFRQMVNDGEVQDGAWAGMIGVTIPLWFFEKQAFGAKEMKSDLAMVKAEAEAKEKAVLYEINDAYSRADANKKLVALYETAFIPQAQEAVNVAFKSYEAQGGDFLNLIDSQRMLLAFKIDHYKAILELRLALADLEKTVGSDIEY